MILEGEDVLGLKELAKDDDVAEAVAFFGSDRSRLITGRRLRNNA